MPSFSLSLLLCSHSVSLGLLYCSLGRSLCLCFLFGGFCLSCDLCLFLKQLRLGFFQEAAPV